MSQSSSPSSAQSSGQVLPAGSREETSQQQAGSEEGSSATGSEENAPAYSSESGTTGQGGY
ncbi:hypothetical protein [Actinoallomurus sp. NPDC050550]|uniref:hypothetical protein n=1 Tax=Actinoallomurus sp. NPDC050550 TaxID=3154937 RepID=UPI0033D9781C